MDRINQVLDVDIDILPNAVEEFKKELYQQLSHKIDESMKARLNFTPPLVAKPHVDMIEEVAEEGGETQGQPNANVMIEEVAAEGETQAHAASGSATEETQAQPNVNMIEEVESNGSSSNSNGDMIEEVGSNGSSSSSSGTPFHVLKAMKTFAKGF